MEAFGTLFVVANLIPVFFGAALSHLLVSYLRIKSIRRRMRKRVSISKSIRQLQTVYTAKLDCSEDMRIACGGTLLKSVYLSYPTLRRSWLSAKDSGAIIIPVRRHEATGRT